MNSQTLKCKLSRIWQTVMKGNSVQSQPSCHFRLISPISYRSTLSLSNNLSCSRLQHGTKWNTYFPQTVGKLKGEILIKSSRAISRVRCTLYTDVSMSISVIIIRVDVETSVYNVHLTRLIAREDFIKCCY
jgi:hypothetical protein